MSATSLVENRWRTYVPGLGSYTAPDPEHASSVGEGRGPAAFTYGAGRPLLNVDPDGRYYFDSSWNDGSGRHHKDIWERSYRAISTKDKQCKCVFKVFGAGLGKSNPFPDPFAISYDATESGALSTWPAFQAGLLPDLGSDAANRSAYGRIKIGEGVARSGTAAYHLAHEIAHTSYNRAHTSGPFDWAAKVGAACSGYDKVSSLSVASDWTYGPLLFAPENNKKIEECVACCE